MKKILLSTVAFVGFTAGALAADLPARTMAPAPLPVMAAPVFTWSGFYIGGHVGYGFGESNNFGFANDLSVPVVGGGTVAVTRAGGGSFFNNGRGGSTEGILGGGQVGFNVQTGMFVFGVEADVSLTDFDRGRNGFFGDNNGFALANPTGPGTVGVGAGIAAPAVGATGNAAGNNVAFFNRNGFGGTDSIDYFGTIRGRVGLAFDRMMIYATGGLAWAEYDNDGARGGSFRNGSDVQANFFVGPGAATAGAGVNGSFNNRRDFDDWGYAVGGGIEYAFTNNISAKIEGLYVDFSGDRRAARNEVVGVSNTGAPITATNFRGGNNNMDFGLIRGGLNFRFNTF